ncbi:TonB-dependent siderophore receptor [Neopusillimonas maritima]|uniref:TonB-dependent siderophore receptor n=2 Tax=Neopusillimonas maritima TaxID=2026239 RepID=A0ABX9N0P1_9BURK|nr:TonB-dependent siderophore receptor [Neopusillimonas maritima]
MNRTVPFIGFSLVLMGSWGAASAQESSVQTLQPIVVEASADASSEGLSPVFAGGQVATGSRLGILGTVDVMDMPFNSVEYTNQFIRDQQARSVADILQSDPTVRIARGFGNYQQLYMIRGFPLYSDDVTYNGLYGLLPRQYLAAEFIERLDVFRGANAFLNGAAPGNSGLGGSINVVPKRAPNEPLMRGSAGWESGNQGYVAVDMARRFGPENRTGIRLNAVTRSGGSAVDDEHRRLGAVGLGIDWKGDRTRLSADIGWQDHRLKRSQPSITFASGLEIPSAIDAERNVAQDYTFSNARDVFGTLRGEFDVTDRIVAWAALGMRESEESSLLANPTVTNAMGDMTQNAFRGERKDSVLTGEVGARAEFETGSVGHKVNVALNFYNFESKNAYEYYPTTNSNLYNPVTQPLPAAPSFTGGSLDDPKRTLQTRNHSIAVSDTLAFAQERVLLTVGARYQVIENQSYDYNTGQANQPSNRSTAISPVVGLVVKPTDTISLYANYIEGLTQVGPASGFNPVPVNLGATFDAVKTKQKEVGIKFDNGDLGLGASLFTLDQPTAYVDPTTRVYGVYGKQRNRGAELTFYGEPMRGLRVLGGMTFLDAKQQQTAGGANDGNRAIGAPQFIANAGLEWDVPGSSGLTLSGRVVHTSSQYVDAANTQQIPAWTRVDLGARYLTEVQGHLLTLRADVLNVANKNYWASAGGYPGSSYLTVGAPRTFMLSASLEY